MRAGLVWKNSGRLADGREIIYFDESPGLTRASVPDTRELTLEQAGETGTGPGTAAEAPGTAAEAPGTAAEAPESGLRWDPLTGEWVIVAAARQERTFRPPADLCPLCPSRPGKPTEIPAPDYDVVVFQNRFPALSMPPPGSGDPLAEGGAAERRVADDAAADGRDVDGSAAAGRAADGQATAGLLAARHPAYGRCEVVCFTSDHDASFAGLTPARARTVVEAWADRTAALGALPGIAQVYCFENRGEEIGVTLHHPHGQVYAMPFIAPRTARMLSRADGYARSRNRNLFDDLVARELSGGVRVVARNDHWTAFVPAAARWPFELMLFPARRVPDLPAVCDLARDAFCELYLDVLGRLDALFGVPMPYIAAWHQAPGGHAGAREFFGLHLQLLPVRRAPGKLKYLAGTESGMGVWSTDVTPEKAASMLRAAQ